MPRHAGARREVINAAISFADPTHARPTPIDLGREAAALADFDFRRAVEAVVRVGDEGNRYVEAAAPWALAKAERRDGVPSRALDAVLAELAATCRETAGHLQPFLPDAAQRIIHQCGDGGPTVRDPRPVFPRLETTAHTTGN